MLGQRLLIKFNGDQGFITPDNGLSPSQMDMNFIGIFKNGAYCEIEVIEFNEENSQLRADLIYSNIGEVSFSDLQLEHAFRGKRVHEMEG